MFNRDVMRCEETVAIDNKGKSMESIEIEIGIVLFILEFEKNESSNTTDPL